MKSRLIILPLVVCFLMVSAALSAQEKAPAQKKNPMKKLPQQSSRMPHHFISPPNLLLV